MREFFFRSFKPGTQLLFLSAICLFSLGLFLEFGLLLIEQLYGFNLSDDPTALNNLEAPFVVDAQKVLLFTQHLGLFILPALIFNRLFSFARESNFILWGKDISLIKTALVVLLMLSAMPLINGLLELNSHLKLPASMAGLENQIKQMEEQANSITSYFIKATGIGQLLVNVLLMAALPALGEEFLFRGVVQKIISRMRRNHHWGIWISAILFSALHFQFYGFLPRMLLGVMFGYICVWTGSIWYAVVAHFVNNATALLLSYFVALRYLPKTIETTGGNVQDWFMLLPSLGLVLYLLWYFWKRNDFMSISQNYTHHPHFVLPTKDNGLG